MVRFGEQFVVISIKAKYAGPYRRFKYLYISSKDIKTRVTFMKLLRQKVKSWSTGTYFLRSADGTVFARFEVIDGRIVKLYKNSPATGELYPCWRYFKKPEPKLKKKVKKKKTIKKTKKK